MVEKERSAKLIVFDVVRRFTLSVKVFFCQQFFPALCSVPSGAVLVDATAKNFRELILFCDTIESKEVLVSLKCYAKAPDPGNAILNAKPRH